MHLLEIELTEVGPFPKAVVPFRDDGGAPRLVTVIHGEGGVGKTTLLSAMSMTRPGHCVATLPRSYADAEAVPQVIAEFRLGQDDPDRPHPLRVASPSVRVCGDDEQEALRRREQALFDRLAREGGFVFVSIAATRWFSRQPVSLMAPARAFGRYDVRAPACFDDASRTDLARDTKQALAYAAIAGALARREPLACKEQENRRLIEFEEAMSQAVNELVGLVGLRYLGLDPSSLEPHFRSKEGGVLPFDVLPTRARHLIAFAALPTRALWAAYPARDPRRAEGIVVIDEVDLHQDAHTQSGLPGALRAALPEVQWILTTSSPVLASCLEPGEVVALRRGADQGQVELLTDSAAIAH